MRGILVGALILSLSATSSTFAAFIYTSQQRNISAIAGRGGGPSNSEQKQTAALGFWSETATASFSDLPNGSASATASQVSDLASQYITMSGNVTAAGTLFYVGGSTSTLNVAFSLSSATPYVSAVSSPGTTGSSVLLSDPITGQPRPYNSNGSGVFPAGDYALSLSFSATASNTSASGSYTYSLFLDGVPEPSSSLLVLVGIVLATVLRRRVIAS
jgi:PEP-CTERM motif-containing protein